MDEIIWQEPVPQPVSDDLLNLTGGNAVVAAALARRGFTRSEQAAAFLDSHLYRLSPPVDFPDLDRAVDRIIMAMRKNERLAVWGDFDVDGQTSTTILTGGLRSLGADVIHHIPVRAKESHGVNLPGLKELIHQGATIVLTCDTGVAAFEAADFCKAAGVDFIVTDHHSLPPTLPAAFAVVNPRRLPAGHPAGSLSGAGAAWFFLRETAERLGRPEEADSWLDLAALGLVADMVELTGDCRCLVQRGLAALRRADRPALTALAAAAGLELKNATEEHISFVIAPRLNALGRLSDANEMVDFFTSTDPVYTGVTSARLDALNLRRKLLTDQVYTAAAAQVEAGRLERDHPVLILYHPLWPAGILGIAASRLVETYHRPAVLLSSADGKMAGGSARSVEGIDITSAISASASLLSGFGGHPMAAGMSIEVENIPQFQRDLERTILSGAAGQPQSLILQLDSNLPFSEINLDLANRAETLAPFGPGNPPLLFTARDVEIASHRSVGRPADHLQLTIRDASGAAQKVMWWNGAGQTLPRGKFDLAFHLRPTSFNGEPQIQVEWIAWRQHDSPLPVEIPSSKISWIDLRNASDPSSDLEKIVASESPQIWEEGAGHSPFPGVDRFNLKLCETLVIWTTPSGWDGLRQALELASPRKIYLFARPVEPSRAADLIKRMLGLLQFAVQAYDGWISFETLAAQTALPLTATQLGIDLILSRSLYRLAGTEAGRMQFVRGAEKVSDINKELEEDFAHLVAEVNAFRALFMRNSIDEIRRIL